MPGLEAPHLAAGNERAYSPAVGNHLSVPGTPSGTNERVLKNDMGYTAVQFAGKKAQAGRVEELVKEKGFIPAELVHNEGEPFASSSLSYLSAKPPFPVAWFFSSLGIDDTYFMLESVETIASHIISLYGSKVLAYTKVGDLDHVFGCRLLLDDLLTRAKERLRSVCKRKQTRLPSSFTLRNLALAKSTVYNTKPRERDELCRRCNRLTLPLVSIPDGWINRPKKRRTVWKPIVLPAASHPTLRKVRMVSHISFSHTELTHEQNSVVTSSFVATSSIPTLRLTRLISKLCLTGNFWKRCPQTRWKSTKTLCATLCNDQVPWLNALKSRARGNVAWSLASSKGRPLDFSAPCPTCIIVSTLCRSTLAFDTNAGCVGYGLFSTRKVPAIRARANYLIDPCTSSMSNNFQTASPS